MSGKLILLFSLVLLAGLVYRYYWNIRDYYYQLKYGAMMVDSELIDKDRALHKAAIKKLTPANLIAGVDPNYFELRGFMEWIRLPMAYPYVMNYYQGLGNDNSVHEGKGVFLTNADHLEYDSDNPDPEEIGGTAYTNDDYGKVLEENIIAFSFNDQYVIGKKASEFENAAPAANSIISYFIFEFGTEKILRFNTYQELMKEVRRIGYKRLRLVHEYYRVPDYVMEDINEQRSKQLTSEESELLLFTELFHPEIRRE
jgi:hypothetical protein